MLVNAPNNRFTFAAGFTFTIIHVKGLFEIARFAIKGLIAVVMVFLGVLAIIAAFARPEDSIPAASHNAGV